MTVKVYGASDDLIEVEGDVEEEYNYYDDERGLPLIFSNGARLTVAYEGIGIWRIQVIEDPDGVVTVVRAPDDDEDNYSDVATIAADIEWVRRGKVKASA